MRLKQPPLFWALLRVTCKIDKKEIGRVFSLTESAFRGVDLMIVRAA